MRGLVAVGIHLMHGLSRADHAQASDLRRAHVLLHLDHVTVIQKVLRTPVLDGGRVGDDLKVLIGQVMDQSGGALLLRTLQTAVVLGLKTLSAFLMAACRFRDQTIGEALGLDPALGAARGLRR